MSQGGQRIYATNRRCCQERCNTTELTQLDHLCAFGMFQTFMFGELTTRVADSESKNNEENLSFCNASVKFLNIGSTLAQDTDF